MSPGIGLMDRRLKTEKDAISLATSGILKNYKTELDTHTVETHIYRLRKKIKENFGINKLILSTKKGYKIA